MRRKYAAANSIPLVKAIENKSLTQILVISKLFPNQNNVRLQPPTAPIIPTQASLPALTPHTNSHFLIFIMHSFITFAALHANQNYTMNYARTYMHINAALNGFSIQISGYDQHSCVCSTVILRNPTF